MVRHRAVRFAKNRLVGFVQLREVADELRVSRRVVPADRGADDGGADLGTARAHAGEQDGQHGPIAGSRQHLASRLKASLHALAPIATISPLAATQIALSAKPVASDSVTPLPRYKRPRHEI